MRKRKGIDEVSRKLIQAFKDVVDKGGHTMGPLSLQQARQIRQSFYRWRMRIVEERTSANFSHTWAAMMGVDPDKPEEGFKYLRMINEVVVLVEPRGPATYWLKFEEYGKHLELKEVVNNEQK